MPDRLTEGERSTLIRRTTTMADCTCIRVTMDICRHCGGTTPMARLEEDRDAARQRAEAAEEWGRGMAESRLNYMTMWGNVRVERDAALMQVSSTARALGEMEAERDALQARVEDITKILAEKEDRLEKYRDATERLIRVTEKAKARVAAITDERDALLWGKTRQENDALQARVEEQDALLRDLAQDRHCHDGKCDHYNHGHYLCTCRLVEYMVPQEATP